MEPGSDVVSRPEVSCVVIAEGVWGVRGKGEEVQGGGEWSASIISYYPLSA